VANEFHTSALIALSDNFGVSTPKSVPRAIKALYMKRDSDRKMYYLTNKSFSKKVTCAAE